MVAAPSILIDFGCVTITTTIPKINVDTGNVFFPAVIELDPAAADHLLLNDVVAFSATFASLQ